MAELRTTLETAEYCIVLVEPRSRTVLGIETNGRIRFPRVRISRQARPVEQLAHEVEIAWQFKVLILDFLSGPDSATPCVVAIVLGRAPASPRLLALALGELPSNELTKEECNCLHSIVRDRCANPLSRIDWVDEAIAWVEEATGKKISSKSNIEQLNAGGGFALTRFGMEGGDSYWLKATGEPNRHECSLTAFLSHLCPSCSPHLIAIKQEWNAWLMAQAGSPLPASPTAEAMISAARGFATLQIETLYFVDDLVATGAFDQRCRVLRDHIEPVIEFLIGAMERQESTRVPALSPDRILELAKILKRACLSMESLGIPDTLIHNDLNRGNILSDQNRCVFIDWSEASIGNPFLACERLCQVNREHRLKVQSVFWRLWAERIDAASIEQAFVLAPLLAIYAYLYGRGNWPRAGNVRSHFDSYARSLARHMDRAAQNPKLRELLCL
jgi:hypothetical protein